MSGPDHRPAEHLVLIDWGTSSLRAVLTDAAGQILDRIASPRGILFTDGRSFPDIYAELFGPWLARYPSAAVLASGMIGSRQGWAEAPYVPCPASFTDLGRAIRFIETPGGGRLGLVPGVSAERNGVPDVMRGEEVQVFGALSGESGTVILPGTHSKWVEVEDRRITGLRTFLTGEVFGLLRTHSILGRLMDQSDDKRPLDKAAFDAGCAASLGGQGTLLHGLFGVRALGLFGRLEPGSAPDYLSGLVIGEEIREALTELPVRPVEVRLVGRGDLEERYARVLSAVGIRSVSADPEAAFHALAALARAVGLVAGAMTP